MARTPSRRPAETTAAPIRADLGRPETPEEAAARKAENSRKYRGAKTPNNLVVALVASLAIVLFLVLVVVRPTPDTTDPVDYAAVAAESQPGIGTRLVAPVLPAEWTSNAARITPAVDGSYTWYIGFVTPADQFIGLEEGIGTDARWLDDFLGSTPATGSVTLDGIDWDIYNRRDADDPGNFAYALAALVGGTQYLLHGTAEDGEFGILASAVAAEIEG